MPELKPLDDIATYKKVADAVYARKAAQGVTNPKAVLASQELEAETGKPLAPPVAPAASIPGVKFTKGFTPEEKAAQRKALADKLKSLDD